MPINTRAAVTAGVATAALLWTLCSAVVALGLASSPAALFGNLFHLGMWSTAAGSSMGGGTGMAGGPMTVFTVTWAGFFIGLIVWSVTVGLIAALFGTIYNRSVQ